MAEPTESPESAVKSGDIAPESDPFHSQIVGDQPSSVDKLGFDEYVDALADFVTDPGTTPPLAVSIEGVWGSGKTSFMRQLEKRLDDDGHPVFWFNPWRHERADSVWAAFMLAFLPWIRTAKPAPRRLRGYLYLLGARLKESRVRRDFARKGLLGAGVVVLALLAVGALGILDGSALTELETTGLLGAGGGLLGLLLWSQRTVERTDAQLRAYIDNPDYADRVSFIQTFHRDLRATLSAYVGDQRVFVVIDDLDRCAVPRAAELMQAINLMLSDDPRLVFIIGMDREKVAAGIAAKHEKIIDFLPESRRTDEHEFGSDYLEKFIQVPFVLPRPDEGELEKFIDDLVESAVPDEPDAAADSPGRDIPGWDRGLVREVTVLVASHLDYNPRKLKKFVNLYRLRAHLADTAALFEWQNWGTRAPTDLTLEQLGKFVAVTVQWPRITDALAADNDLLSKLVEYDEDPDAVSDTSRRFEYWRGRDGLTELLRAVPDGADEETAEAYSLKTVRVSELLQISPQLSTGSDVP